MLLRICLIVTIVAGLAAGAVSFIYVKEIITTTRSQRDDFHQKWDDTTATLDKTKKDLKKTTADLDATKSKLAQTQSDLNAATAKAADLEKRNTDISKELETTRADRDTAQQQLAQWDQIGLKPGQVKGLIADLDKARAEIVVMKAENKILAQDDRDWHAKYDYIAGNKDQVVQEPTGLSGTVMVVDPKYEFVVLDIGEDKGVLERGELLVSRHGHFIGKVRISSVSKDRSIANIEEDWKQGEVMEGDKVITRPSVD